MRVRQFVIVACCACLAIALVARFRAQGGPYLSPPRTVYDHVSPAGHPAIADIVLCRLAASLMRGGATVAMLKPSEKPHYDTTHTNTAAGLLMHQRVVAPGSGTPEYVITIGETLDDARYQLVRTFPEGSLYSRR
jgi:hypothetical protein